MKNPNEPDSPVLELMGGRGTLYNIIHKEENNRRFRVLKEEIFNNDKIVVRLFEDCVNNQELRKKDTSDQCRFPALTLSLSATEFLYINRYMALPDEFYLSLLTYYRVAETINHHLLNWISDKENAEKWFLKNFKTITKKTDNLKKQLETIEFKKTT